MSTKSGAVAPHWTDRAPSRAGKRAITFYVDSSVFEALKMRAAREGFRPVQGIMEELVVEYLGHGAVPEVATQPETDAERRVRFRAKGGGGASS